MPEHDEAPVGSGGLIAERQDDATCPVCHGGDGDPCARCQVAYSEALDRRRAAALRLPPLDVTE